MSAKAQPDHAGLQTDPSNNAPEVVPQTRPWAPVERKSSQSKPEYYAPPHSPPQYEAPVEKSSASPHYHDRLAHPPNWEGQQQSGDKDAKSICGLRRRTFIWVAVAIALVAVIAIVLGAVLGTLLGSDSSSSTQVQTSGNDTALDSSNTTTISLDSSSGFAAAYPVGSSNLYIYYQDEQGRIIENQLIDGAWVVQNDDVPDNAIVAEGVRSGSPLATISWTSNGANERQVFYLNGNDQVMAANTTNENVWNTAYQVPETDPATPDSLALSACVDTKAVNAGLSGIRMDYASSTDNRIEETGMDFWESEENIWHNWTYFGKSDPASGAACLLTDDVTHLYIRNSSTGAVAQWTWNYYDQYVNGVAGWSTATTGPSTTGKTDLAAATDGDGTDYVFYQDNDGNLVRMLEYGQGLTNDLVIGPAARESRFAAAYGAIGSNEGVFVIYWTSNSPPQAVYRQLDRSGTVLLSGTLG